MAKHDGICQDGQDGDQSFPAHNHVQAATDQYQITRHKEICKRPTKKVTGDSCKHQANDQSPTKEDTDGGRAGQAKDPKAKKGASRLEDQVGERRYPAHSDVPARDYKSHASESLAKQQRSTELQEEQEQEAKHDETYQVGDQRSPAHSYAQARGSESLACESLAKQLIFAKLQEEQEQAAKHDVIGQVGDRRSPAHSHGQASGSGGFASECPAKQPRFAKRQEGQEQEAKHDEICQVGDRYFPAHSYVLA